MATQIMETKLESERTTLEFDFLSRLGSGESVATAATGAVLWSGASEPVTIISGLPTVSGSIVSQLVVGGSPGKIYKVSCSVRTNLNNILINESKLAVLSDDAITPP